MRFLHNYIFILAFTCITMNLMAKEHQVTIHSSICGDETSYAIADSATLTLYATPDVGCRFVRWSDGDTNNPRVVTVISDATYSAVFELIDGGSLPQAFTTNFSAEGCTIVLSKDFNVGTSLIIEAIPKLGFRFKQWSDGNTQNPRVVSVSEAASYQAEFEQYANIDIDESTMYKVQVKTDGCDASYVHQTMGGAKVVLTAQSVGCSSFSHWSDGNADNPRVVFPNSDTTYIAVFNSYKEKEFTKEFSISDTSKIIFSQGNLQYRACDNVWRFAENQYDMVGAGNENISATYEGFIDLFGWGTSGYHNDSDEFNTQYQPYATSKSDVDLTNNRYGYGPSLNQTDKNLVKSSANYDWGVYNTIRNRGKENRWRTLTQNQWFYLINSRAKAAEKWFRGSVNGVSGIILLPDEYAETTIPYTTGVTNFTTNSFSSNEWDVMEKEGAVFLPAAGSRSGTTYTAGTASYHSTTARDSARNYITHFTDVNTSYSYVGPRYVGRAVRLVKDVEEKYTITTAGENGTIAGGGTYNSGATATLVATPNTCYKFVQWSDGNTDNPRTVIVNTDATYTAIFEENRYTITVESADEAQGTVNVEMN